MASLQRKQHAAGKGVHLSERTYWHRLIQVGGVKTTWVCSRCLTITRSSYNASAASAALYHDYQDASLVFAGVQGIHHYEPGECSPTAGMDDEPSGAALPAEETAQTRPNLLKSMAEILQLSLPLTLTNVSGFTLNCLSDSLVGRLGATALSTTTLANSFYGMMGISVIWGGAAGMETLAGQAFGAGNLRMMRLVLMRAMVVCWALCLPIAWCWQHAEWLMIKLGQCPTMAANGAVYLQALVPSLFVYVLAECLQSYLVCQNNVQPATIAKGITAALGPVFYYLLMFKMHLGLTGAAYAYALCKLTNALLLIGWLAWDKGRSASAAVAQSSGAPAASAAGGSAIGSIAASDNHSQQAASANGHVAAQGSDHTTGSEHAALSTRRGNGHTGDNGTGATSSQHEESATSSSNQSSQNSAQAASTPGVPIPVTAAVAAAAAATAAISVVPDISLSEVLDLKGAWEYVKYGLPSAMMTLLEWWAYEINVILAGTLPNAEVAVAVLGICLAISGWVYMFPQSISTATCTRISNSLGGGDAQAARSYFYGALLMVACTQVTLASTILLAGRHLVDFFCHDPGVMHIALGIVPIVACNVLADGMNVVLNGVLRACGRQALGARLQLCSYWLIGVPLSWYLGVKSGLGTAGFLIAIGLTSFTQAIVCGTMISRFNWRQEVQRSQKLLSKMSQTMDPAK